MLCQVSGYNRLMPAGFNLAKTTILPNLSQILAVNGSDGVPVSNQAEPN